MQVDPYNSRKTVVFVAVVAIVLHIVFSSVKCYQYARCNWIYR